MKDLDGPSLEDRQKIAQAVVDISFKADQITLKSGAKSPLYIDMRQLYGFPKLWPLIADLYWSKMKDLQFDLICGVPMTAILFSTVISFTKEVPLIIKRDSVKEYGTKQLVQGKFQPGQKVVIVEDVATSGQSILETVTGLRDTGLIVEDAVVFVDRNQGAAANLAQHGMKLRSVFMVDEIITNMVSLGKISSAEATSISNWLKNNQQALKSS